MKPSFVLGIALLAVGISNGAGAQGTSLILPIQPSVMFQHATTGAPLGRAGYFLPGAPPPTWVVAQWGNPSNLLPSSGAATGWLNANATTRVQYYPSMYGYSNVYELAQAGNRCNAEFDLFLSPGDPAFVPGTALGITRSAPLTSIGSLRVDVGTHVYYSVAGTACIQQGYWDYGQFVYSLVLNSTNGQVLFYQINLGNTSPSRQALGPISWCPAEGSPRLSHLIAPS